MKKIESTKFREQIRRCIENSGINQKQLADAVGVTQGSVTGWIKGAVPHGQTLQKVADFFGCTTDYLLYGEEYKKRKEESDAQIMEAVEHANRYSTGRERQIAFEGKLNEQMVFEYRKRAEVAEKKLDVVKDCLRKLLDEL